MHRTFEDINERITSGKVVVATAEEIIDLARAEGTKKAFEKVDVVTTGTFGPMCSSGVFLNVGHPRPRMKMARVWLNGVEAYGGIAAVDLYLGATQIPDGDPANRHYPGLFRYGGGHVIEDLVAGKEVSLVATGYGTDCYPRKEFRTSVQLASLPDATLFNPRNCYQNYNAAVNLSHRTIYTYMGLLKPDLANINYCSAGRLSPLLKDPLYRTIGIGTRVFLGGGTGYVAWHGTQHHPDVPRTEAGIPKRGAGTLALVGNLKEMKPEWLRGISMVGYGVSLAVGVGVPIPLLDEEILEAVLVDDDRIFAPVVDYAAAYPEGLGEVLAEVSYAELKSGSVRLLGRDIPSFGLSSYAKAVEIATLLKRWIASGRFCLTRPVAPLPGAVAAAAGRCA